MPCRAPRRSLPSEPLVAIIQNEARAEDGRQVNSAREPREGDRDARNVNFANDGRWPTRAVAAGLLFWQHRRPSAAGRGDRTAHLFGRERRNARSKRQVRIKVRRPVVWHKLITPSLLSLMSVHGPDGLAQDLQYLEHGQCLLARPVGRHNEGRWRLRLRLRVHAAALRERSAVLRALRSTLRAASRSPASFCR